MSVHRCNSSRRILGRRPVWPAFVSLATAAAERRTCDRLAVVAGFVFGSYPRAAVGQPRKDATFARLPDLSLAEDDAPAAQVSRAPALLNMLTFTWEVWSQFPAGRVFISRQSSASSKENDEASVRALWGVCPICALRESNSVTVGRKGDERNLTRPGQVGARRRTPKASGARRWSTGHCSR